MSHELHDILHKKGVVSHLSCLYTPQWNRVVKLANRHLLDTTKTLLIKSFVPSKLWVEALLL